MIGTILAVSLLAIGCKKDEAEEAAPDRKVYTLDGKPDEKFVGKWKSTDGLVNYDLSADGGYVFDGKVKLPSGFMNSKFSSKWCVKDKDILFADQQGNVAAYAYALEGDKLKLTLYPGLKIVTQLVKQK